MTDYTENIPRMLIKLEIHGNIKICLLKDKDSFAEERRGLGHGVRQSSNLFAMKRFQTILT